MKQKGTAEHYNPKDTDLMSMTSETLALIIANCNEWEGPCEHSLNSLTTISIPFHFYLFGQ